MRYRVALLLFLFVPGFLLAQDSTGFVKAFLVPKATLNIRTAFLATLNRGSLKDDEAWGTLAGVSFSSSGWKGLRWHAAASIEYNCWSTDLTRPDPTTGMFNRYEVGLFDISNFSRKYNLSRIDLLNLVYTRSKTSVTVGRMKLNTPLLNPQDGRLNTTVEEGIWFSSAEHEKWIVQGGAITRISPRSTFSWFNVGESFGIYPSGVNVNGVKSDYAHHVHSRGLGILNVQFFPRKSLRFSVWDYWIDQVMNTLIWEHNFTYGTSGFSHGLMYIRQDAIQYGGNPDPALTYIPKGGQSNTVSAQLAYTKRRFNASVNGTWISRDGRYLAPREWGRDPLYTFLQRERNDGYGGVLATSVNAGLQSADNRLKSSVGAGYFHLPDVKDSRLNKYGVPAYYQINCSLGYAFQKKLKGLEFRFLAVGKIAEGPLYGNPRYVYNKVDLLLLSFTTDYTF